jgi:tetratricopeptide (TPR) repeat protein/cell division protein FtsN
MLRWFIVLAFIIFYQSLDAQNWNLIYDRELEAEGYMLDKQYERAAKKYEDALKLYPQSASLNYKVGTTYLLTPNKKHLALNFLKEAAKGASIDFNPRAIKQEFAPIEAWYELGRALQMDNQFDKAIEAFTKFKQFLEPDDSRHKDVEARIESCRKAPLLMADAQGLETVNLGNTINKKDANFNAVISGDGQTLAYTTLGSKGYEVYIAKKKGDAWERPRRITDDIRGGFLKTSSLSYDGTWLYLVDDFSSPQNIYDTFYDEGWVRSKKLKKPVTSKYNETHAALSPDGKTLYFASDRPDGLGGLDIYKSTLDKKERWDDPVNLGSRVNTPVDEDTPFITPDGRYLFFSSQGHNSIGGFDIFYVDLQGNGEPVNLGHPVNDADDNLFYYPTSLNRGVMALSKSDGFGPQDIYDIKIIPLVTVNGNIASVDNQKKANGEVVKVSLFDSESQEPIDEIDAKLGEASFTKKLLPGEYRVVTKAEGFEDFATNFEINESPSTQSIDISLIPIPQEPEHDAQLAEQITDDLKLEDGKVEETPEVVKEEEIPSEPENTDPEVLETVQVIEEKQPEEVEALPKVEKEQKVEQPKTKAPEPKVYVASRSADGKFTVQIMALLVPIDISHFKNIEGLMVTRGNDGYHRYTVGAVSSRAEAVAIQRELRQLGYKEAFVKRYESKIDQNSGNEVVEPNFTIQVMALKSPVDVNRFSNLPDIKVEQGGDSFYRYFTGNYATYQQAINDLSRVEQLGYKGAFVRKL